MAATVKEELEEMEDVAMEDVVMEDVVTEDARDRTRRQPLTSPVCHGCNVFVADGEGDEDLGSRGCCRLTENHTCKRTTRNITSDPTDFREHWREPRALPGTDLSTRTFAEDSLRAAENVGFVEITGEGDAAAPLLAVGFFGGPTLCILDRHGTVGKPCFALARWGGLRRLLPIDTYPMPVLFRSSPGAMAQYNFALSGECCRLCLSQLHLGFRAGVVSLAPGGEKGTSVVKLQARQPHHNLAGNALYMMPPLFLAHRVGRDGRSALFGYVLRRLFGAPDAGVGLGTWAQDNGPAAAKMLSGEKSNRVQSARGSAGSSTKRDAISAPTILAMNSLDSLVLADLFNAGHDAAIEAAESLANAIMAELKTTQMDLESVPNIRASPGYDRALFLENEAFLNMDDSVPHDPPDAGAPLQSFEQEVTSAQITHCIDQRSPTDPREARYRRPCCPTWQCPFKACMSYNFPDETGAVPRVCGECQKPPETGVRECGYCTGDHGEEACAGSLQDREHVPLSRERAMQQWHDADGFCGAALQVTLVRPGREPEVRTLAAVRLDIHGSRRVLTGKELHLRVPLINGLLRNRGPDTNLTLYLDNGVSFLCEQIPKYPGHMLRILVKQCLQLVVNRGSRSPLERKQIEGEGFTPGGAMPDATMDLARRATKVAARIAVSLDPRCPAAEKGAAPRVKFVGAEPVALPPPAPARVVVVGLQAWLWHTPDVSALDMRQRATAFAQLRLGSAPGVNGAQALTVYDASEGRLRLSKESWTTDSDAWERAGRRDELTAFLGLRNAASCTACSEKPLGERPQQCSCWAGLSHLFFEYVPLVVDSARNPRSARVVKRVREAGEWREPDLREPGIEALGVLEAVEYEDENEAEEDHEPRVENVAQLNQDEGLLWCIVAQAGPTPVRHALTSELRACLECRTGDRRNYCGPGRCKKPQRSYLANPLGIFLCRFYSALVQEPGMSFARLVRGSQGGGASFASPFSTPVNRYERKQKQKPKDSLCSPVSNGRGDGAALRRPRGQHEREKLDFSARMVGHADAAAQEDDGNINSVPTNCHLSSGEYDDQRGLADEVRQLFTAPAGQPGSRLTVHFETPELALERMLELPRSTRCRLVLALGTEGRSTPGPKTIVIERARRVSLVEVKLALKAKFPHAALEHDSGTLTVRAVPGLVLRPLRYEDSSTGTRGTILVASCEEDLAGPAAGEGASLEISPGRRIRLLPADHIGDYARLFGIPSELTVVNGDAQKAQPHFRVMSKTGMELGPATIVMFQILYALGHRMRASTSKDRGNPFTYPTTTNEDGKTLQITALRSVARGSGEDHLMVRYATNLQATQSLEICFTREEPADNETPAYVHPIILLALKEVPGSRLEATDIDPARWRGAQGRKFKEGSTVTWWEREKESWVEKSRVLERHEIMFHSPATKEAKRKEIFKAQAVVDMPFHKEALTLVSAAREGNFYRVVLQRHDGRPVACKVVTGPDKREAHPNIVALGDCAAAGITAYEPPLEGCYRYISTLLYRLGAATLMQTVPETTRCAKGDLVLCLEGTRFSMPGEVQGFVHGRYKVSFEDEQVNYYARNEMRIVHRVSVGGVSIPVERRSAWIRGVGLQWGAVGKEQWGLLQLPQVGRMSTSEMARHLLLNTEQGTMWKRYVEAGEDSGLAQVTAAPRQNVTARGALHQNSSSFGPRQAVDPGGHGGGDDMSSQVMLDWDLTRASAGEPLLDTDGWRRCLRCSRGYRGDRCLVCGVGAGREPVAMPKRVRMWKDASLHVTSLAPQHTRGDRRVASAPWPPTAIVPDTDLPRAVEDAGGAQPVHLVANASGTLDVIFGNSSEGELGCLRCEHASRTADSVPTAQRFVVRDPEAFREVVRGLAEEAGREFGEKVEVGAKMSRVRVRARASLAHAICITAARFQELRFFDLDLEASHYEFEKTVPGLGDVAAARSCEPDRLRNVLERAPVSDGLWKHLPDGAKRGETSHWLRFGDGETETRVTLRAIVEQMAGAPVQDIHRTEDILIATVPRGYSLRFKVSVKEHDTPIIERNDFSVLSCPVYEPPPRISPAYAWLGSCEGGVDLQALIRARESGDESVVRAESAKCTGCGACGHPGDIEDMGGIAAMTAGEFERWQVSTIRQSGVIKEHSTQIIQINSYLGGEAGVWFRWSALQAAKTRLHDNLTRLDRLLGRWIERGA